MRYLTLTVLCCFVMLWSAQAQDTFAFDDDTKLKIEGRLCSTLPDTEGGMRKAYLHQTSTQIIISVVDLNADNTVGGISVYTVDKAKINKTTTEDGVVKQENGYYVNDTLYAVVIGCNGGRVQCVEEASYYLSAENISKKKKYYVELPFHDEAEALKAFKEIQDAL
ncbi:hypothetical protein [Eisenibacter elegans]|uniref:hypothetical protein n=1 Tax=Eisenibacter elegans TaxID=997 RepID=UPI00047A9980|nr:hypothetical protein [Eisenibacter elegans]